jgi:glyoxylase-like metal-dependent hydrolase (beta-lactamase superfamily II)
MGKALDYFQLVVGPLQTNCYLVYSPQSFECLVIDPGAEGKRIISFIKKKNLIPIGIINTHGHIDHIGANKSLKMEFNLPILIHPEDSSLLTSKQNLALSILFASKTSPPADTFLKEGQKIKIGNSSLEVIHTPGHTPGGISLRGDEFVLTGDTLFAGGVGRTDLPGGSWDYLLKSIKNKLLKLPDNLIVLPGHGFVTTIGEEKENNPFIRGEVF